MLPRYTYWILLVIVCGYALWRGRAEERTVAATAIIASILSLLALSTWRSRYAQVEFGLAAVDIGVLAVFIAVALQSRRYWPLWVAGLQLTTSIAHIFKAVDLELLPYAYGAALRFWSYPILLILLIGTIRSRRPEPVAAPAAA